MSSKRWYVTFQCLFIVVFFYYYYYYYLQQLTCLHYLRKINFIINDL